MLRFGMTIAILLPILAQGDVIGDGDASPDTCTTDGHNCTASADDVGLWLMQRRSALLASDRHPSGSEIAFDGTSGRFHHQIETDVQEVVAMYERLGYPRDELVQQLKDQLRSVSLSEVHGRWGLSKEPMSVECIAINAAATSYRFGASKALMGAKAGMDKLLGEGFEFVRGFELGNNTDDVDYVGWWEKGGDCFFNWQGSDSKQDFEDDFDATLINAFGIDGLHQGLVKEFTDLVELIPFRDVRRKCRSSLTSIGHSLGGGLAQMFALVLNRADDPLDANIKADSIYSFGGMPPGRINFPDDHAQDGCFAGKLFYNGQRNADGTIGVDIVNNPKIGGLTLEPIKADKAVLISAKDHMDFECGTLIPNSFADTKFNLHLIPIYQKNLGCIGALEFVVQMGSGLVGAALGKLTGA